MKKHWIDFLGVHFGSPRGAVAPKPHQNIFLLNMDWKQKTVAPYVKQFKKLMFGVATWGGPWEGGTSKLCQDICLFGVSWYQRCSTLA